MPSRSKKSRPRRRQKADVLNRSSRRESRPRACSVRGCERKHESRGYCATHAARFRKWGDPRADQPIRKKAANGSGWTDRGYRYVYRPGHPLADKRGRVAEHRLVVYEHYGAEALPEGFQVHHKVPGPAARSDNRIERLEVRIGAHGSGGAIRDVMLAGVRDYARALDLERVAIREWSRNRRARSLNSGRLIPAKQPVASMMAASTAEVIA